MTAAPDIDEDEDVKRKRNRESQARHRERERMERAGFRYVDDVPVRREAIGIAVTLKIMDAAAIGDDKRAAYEIHRLMERAIELACKYPSLAKELKVPQ